MKCCTLCGLEKPIVSFSLRGKLRDGRTRYSSRCKECLAADWRGNPEWDRRPRLTAEERTERKEARASEAAERRRRNRPARLAAVRDCVRKWRRDNPEVVRTYNARRYALTRTLCVERVVSLGVLERDDGVCGICGEDVDPFDYEVDHIIPLARGGEHSYANTQVAHPLCNARKGTALD